MILPKTNTVYGAERDERSVKSTEISKCPRTFGAYCIYSDISFNSFTLSFGHRHLLALICMTRIDKCNYEKDKIVYIFVDTPYINSLMKTVTDKIPFSTLSPLNMAFYMHSELRTLQMFFPIQILDT